MPITIPPFVQYQEQMPPLRGLWNSAPPEGDRFVSASISWGITTAPSMAVQFDLAGNSPVAFSQIVSINVDNSRCGADVAFLFPDSGSVLVVPAYADLIAPVFTNALMFYAAATNAAPGDVTIFQVFNSMPPPVAVQTPSQQEYAGAITAPLPPATTQIIPRPLNGTLRSLQIVVASGPPTANEIGQLQLIDGTGRIIWSGFLGANGGQWTDTQISVPVLNVRFFDGLTLITSGGFTVGEVSVNAYYSLP